MDAPAADDRVEVVRDSLELTPCRPRAGRGQQIVSHVYGDLYTRPALTDRDRELGAVVALTALGRSSQLPQHLRAALKAGLTEAELREAIMLTASIAGFPPAMNATATLKNVLAERERDEQDPSA